MVLVAYSRHWMCTRTVQSEKGVGKKTCCGGAGVPWVVTETMKAKDALSNCCRARLEPSSAV